MDVKSCTELQTIFQAVEQSTTMGSMVNKLTEQAIKKHGLDTKQKKHSSRKHQKGKHGKSGEKSEKSEKSERSEKSESDATG